MGRSGTKNVNGKSNRSKPMTPKAGFTQTRRRYGKGGSIKK